MKRPAYSAYRSGIWPLFRAHAKDRSEQGFARFATSVLLRASALNVANRAGTSLTSVPDMNTAHVLLQCEFLWRYRRIAHYFLAPGVGAFCAGSVKTLTPDYCKRLPLCRPVALPAGIAAPECPFPSMKELGHPSGKPDEMNGAFAIHFPAGESDRSVLCIPSMRLLYQGEDGTPLTYQWFFAATDGSYMIQVANTERMDADVRGMNEILGDPVSARMARVLFGLSLYMDAFPDTVVEAKADEIHEVRHYEGFRHAVRANEIVCEEGSRSVEPHWRKGHWKLLSAPRFVHKRGMSVWEKGTYIKGEALDVLDDAPGLHG